MKESYQNDKEQNYCILLTFFIFVYTILLLLILFSLHKHTKRKSIYLHNTLFIVYLGLHMFQFRVVEKKIFDENLSFNNIFCGSIEFDITCLICVLFCFVWRCLFCVHIFLLSYVIDTHMRVKFFFYFWWCHMFDIMLLFFIFRKKNAWLFKWILLLKLINYREACFRQKKMQLLRKEILIFIIKILSIFYLLNNK